MHECLNDLLGIESFKFHYLVMFGTDIFSEQDFFYHADNKIVFQFQNACIFA